MNSAYQDYVGIPFVDNGRDIVGYDCWGLVKALYLQYHGQVLPDFIYNEAESPTVGAFFVDELFIKDAWREVEPSEGGIAVFMVAGAIRHVGFMIDDRHFIHTIKGCATVIEDIRGIRWSGRYKGCYLWQHKL